MAGPQRFGFLLVFLIFSFSIRGAQAGEHDYQSDNTPVVRSPESMLIDIPLDEAGLIHFSVEIEQDRFRIGGWQTRPTPGVEKTDIPTRIRHGLTFVVNGQAERYIFRGKYPYKEFLSRDIPVGQSPVTIEVQFYGRKLGQYRISPQGFEPLTPPRLLSRFDIKAIYNDRFKGAPSESANLRNFKKHGASVSSQPSPYSSRVDLHTHLTGAVRTDDLMAIAEKHRTLYPIELLKKMSIRWNEKAVVKVDGKDFVPFSRQNIDYMSDWDQYSISLEDQLHLPTLSSVPFSEMNRVYAFRSPLLKNLTLFPEVLEALAKDYQRNGVKYVELSFYTIVDPQWLAVANRVLPELEKRYDVKLRFLVGAWRHSDLQENLKVIEQTKKAMQESPYVVGIDFMGEETNSTIEILEPIREAAKLKGEFPNIAIRVHAGENPLHPRNIEDAIRAGANRIGHGIYGVTSEAVKLAKDNDVIIEFNLNSNLALQNVAGTRPLFEAAKRYLSAGARVTFGTDGHGIYHTSPKSEEAVGRAIGFANHDFLNVRRSDERYIQRMDLDFRERSSRMKNALISQLKEPSQMSQASSNAIACRDIFAH